MGTPYRTVRLIRNQSYPTYQLRATMANSKTSPQEGLRLAALTTMDWLRQRLGENAPEEVLHLPEPADYRSVSDESLVSFHIHSGYVVDVVSLPAQGIWTLQITEPDLGSDPGDPGQARQAVPGRVIETNIGYRIIGTQLECGFQTVVSDPEGTEAQAEVYRLAVVRQLLEHLDFGLRQIIPLSYKVGSITSAEQLKDLFSIWRAKENHLPCVIFTSPSQDWKAKELPRVRFEDPLAMGSSLHMVSDTCKIFQETIELLQDDFLKKIKDIYSPLIDANTEMKVNRIQLDTPKSQNRESANHKEPPSEENILDIFADDMADILHMRKALLSSLQKIFVQLQLQRENTTQGPENLATIKQEAFTAIEDFYSQASNGLRQYTLKLSATYGTAALSSLSARREEINAISQK